MTISYHFDVLSTNFFILGDYKKMNYFRINPDDRKNCFVSDQGPLIAFIVMFSFHILRGPLKSTHHLLGLVSYFLLPHQMQLLFAPQIVSFILNSNPEPSVRCRTSKGDPSALQ